MMRKSLHLLLADTHAAAAAEMALILPMAFALIFTTMEAGHYFQTEHKAIKYVREGARFAARQKFDYYDCSGSNQAFNTAATGASTVRDQIRNVTLTGFPSGGSARIADWQASQINITVTCNATFGTGLYAGTVGVKAPKVLVWTRFDYTPIVGMLGFDIIDIDVVAQAEAPVMGI